MNLEEAKKEYGICVPSEDVFYSNEYKEYFRNKPEIINPNFEIYREFDEIYKKSFLLTFGNNIEQTKNRKRKAVVLGGQAGAGKANLAILANVEAQSNNHSYYLIDDDQYRKFYPRHDEIIEKCLEHSTVLTAIGSGNVTPKIMKYASDNGLNFIFDGTMKNTRILETAKKWEDYDITFKVMATSRMESLISIFERNVYLRKEGLGRPVTIDLHDEMYYGLENTIRTMENNGNYNIEIYMRGNGKTALPVLIYSPNEKGMYKNALEALICGRQRDKKRCINNDIYTRIAQLEDSELGTINESEAQELSKLKEVLKDEMER